MFNFKDIPFFDNHTHLIDTSNREITLRQFITPFAHGYGDILPEGAHFGDPVNSKPDSCTEDYLNTIVANLGVTKTLVAYLSELFGCEPKLETVLAERNKRSLADMKGYTEMLYRDQNIIGEMIDSPLPMGAPELNVFPAKIYRLWQIDPRITDYYKEASNYDELLERLDHEVRTAIAVDKFDGVKYHILEKMTQEPRIVSDAEAREAFTRAKAGDKLAYEDVYFAIFCHMLRLTQELEFPIHIHTGITGKTGHGIVRNLDPFVFCRMLNNDTYYRSRIVFLHCSYPNTRNVAVMANTYPYIWADMAQVLPWASLNFAQIVEEIIGMAPNTKIMFGTGSHNHPELIWMSSKIAKSALEFVMENCVKRGVLTKPQAVETAEQLLYKNALRLYGEK